jgi:hypothetical protein
MLTVCEGLSPATPIFIISQFFLKKGSLSFLPGEKKKEKLVLFLEKETNVAVSFHRKQCHSHS